MLNAKNQPIIDGDILAESYTTPIEERIIVIEDVESEKLYWRRLMATDITIKQPLNTLEGQRYITLENMYKP